VAMPPATAPPAASSSSLAAAPVASPPPARASSDARPSGQVGTQAEVTDSRSSEASSQRLPRRKSENRRRNQARPDTPPRAVTIPERQAAGGEAGWNAYDRGWGRNDTGRQSYNPPNQSPSERRGSYSW
jgi:hypothetical protein